MSDKQVDINQMVKDLFSKLSKASEHRDSVELLTLTKVYKSLLKLKDDN